MDFTGIKKCNCPNWECSTCTTYVSPLSNPFTLLAHTQLMLLQGRNYPLKAKLKYKQKSRFTVK